MGGGTAASSSASLQLCQGSWENSITPQSIEPPVPESSGGRCPVHSAGKVSRQLPELAPQTRSGHIPAPAVTSDNDQ